MIVGSLPDGLPKALMGGVILPQSHQDFALQKVPVRVLAIGAGQLPKRAFQIALIDQALGKVLGLSWEIRLKPTRCCDASFRAAS